VLAGVVPLNKYIITKQLTKRPDDYPDARNQPHVQVALRRRASGKQNGVMAVSGVGGRGVLAAGWLAGWGCS
jgi:DNA polymerase alpha subunit A